MLALAAVNAAGAALFAGVYAAAGARVLNQAAFLAGLVVFFVAVTAIWVRVEAAQGARRHPLQRLARVTGALAITLLAVPGLTLMPLFALRDHLPPDDGIDLVIRSIMVLLLVSLVLVVIVNVVGGAVTAASAAGAWRRRARP